MFEKVYDLRMNRLKEDEMHCCCHLHWDYPRSKHLQTENFIQNGIDEMSPDTEQGIMLKLYIS